MSTKLLRRVAAGAVAAATAIGLPLAAQAQKTLRVAMHSDLKIIDPIWTTALIATDHAYLIYDTLFSPNEKLEMRPQMVDTWSVSDDKLTWTFTLREGLEWHDGKPVTAEDCVASLKRWSARDSMGQKLSSFIADMTATDARTFTMKLKEPYGLVIESLGKLGSNVPFMMPKRVADTEPTKQIEDTTGSGPFIFKRDEWKPGEKAVYLRNPKYKPRSEPPSGLSGGKVAKVDRIEWIAISDPQTQVNSILSGEIDMIQAPPHDLLPLLKKDPNIELRVFANSGRQNAMRFNTLHKPLDNPKIRQAIAHALTQKDYLDATIGDPEWYSECKSLFPCGTPFESNAGWENVFGNVAKARQLLAEAGYDGTPIVLMQSTDVASLANLAPVAKAQMERVGLKVDLQAMDWQTLVARRAKKDAPSAGGWHMFLTSWGAVDVTNPVNAAFLNTSCEKATFGWPCDAEMEKLRDQFSRETDPARQKALAEAVQRRQLEVMTHVHLGQYVQPAALRKGVTGFLAGGTTVFWNIEKN
ncbi:MAG: ABC transporter substrate-binding protein [Hyphomicrobiales bacterium]|nr:ABC transporter substrate-binding protein [Hyphomicrobiales bacterium]